MLQLSDKEGIWYKYISKIKKNVRDSKHIWLGINALG